MPLTYVISDLNSFMKNATGVDTSKFVNEADLASLKSKIDKLDVDKLQKITSGSNNLKSKLDKLDVKKLEPVPVDLKKLSDVVNNETVNKTVYDELVNKVNAINTSGHA